MKILFATESYYPNIDGGAIAQHRLVHELVKRGNEVAVIAPSFSFKNCVEQDKGSTIFRPRGLTLPFYMNNKYHFSPLPIFQSNKIIKIFKPDVVNVCSPYPIGANTVICAKKYRIPIIGSIHILPENMLSPFLNSRYYSMMNKYSWKYLVYFFNLVDWATAPTQTGANMYIDRGLKTKITPISNGVNTEIFNPNNNGEYLRKKFNIPKENIVLYTGRMSSEKNLDVLVKAIPLVVKEIDAHFLFCGSGGGYKQKMKKLTEKLHVSGSTTFVDFLDWQDYINIYSLADLFVMPAEAELQSIVTMEAISSGLPAVVVNKGAVPELVSLDNGFLFEPRNSKQLASNIIKILSDKNLRNTMSKNSLELIKNHSMSHVGCQFEKVYVSVIESYKNK
ncbi:MAG: glycosyltransferase [Thermoplasmatales archaeon]|nr:MAG: glycosyltransferase [Thermoplasmatales archaeon]